jgi:hypothetical protein
MSTKAWKAVFRPESSDLFRFSALLVGAFALAWLVAGCATEVGHHTFLKQTYPAKPENSPIEVFSNGLPRRGFERVAVLDVHCESQGFLTPNLAHDVVPALIKQARAAGCDAIIEIEERKTPANWTFETRTKDFTAMGIVFR